MGKEEGHSGLFDPWVCCAQPADAIRDPEQLRSAPAEWIPARVPGTVAAALRDAGAWSLDRPLEADASDWWFRTTFASPEILDGDPCVLCLDGLATLAEVWLNGEPLLRTENMFRAYRAEIASRLKPRNELVIAFRSLTACLAQKRPRPRWKTSLVQHQQLRWHRATLLGRIPGWSPPVAPVGPWRDVRLETGPVLVEDSWLNCALEEETGFVRLRAAVRSRRPIERAILRVGERETPVAIQSRAQGVALEAELPVASPRLWWPHTHGEPSLYDAELILSSDSTEHRASLGWIGFRRLEAEREPGFGLRVNSAPVYCRGACWTVGDIVTLDGGEASLMHDLRLARDAGMNMLRVGGTMVYESDRFYRLCDELGILVWQDFMFANMDYPVEDPAFAANIEAEASQQLTRLARHPSIAVYCGNSEVEQQAAMLGVDRARWRNEWFAERLPALRERLHPGTAYWPSTPCEGAMPFYTREGLTHFYGVGAYLRSPAELRQADVKFTPECLGFANLPEAAALRAVADGAAPVFHHPRWKQRVPRDTGAGWDFEDVRDFYLNVLFDADPVRLRSFDPARYLELSRVVPGEMMARVFAEWRGGHSRNRGGLVWFFKDLWPGAGWGIVDSLGLPKAAYYYLRRAWRPRQISLTDEGLEGMHIHVVNETASPFHGSAELLLLKDGRIPVARRELACELSPWERRTYRSEEFLEQFYDINHAYRFGPPSHEIVVATLLDDRGDVLSEAYQFLSPRDARPRSDVALEVRAEAFGPEERWLALRADRFLQCVSFDLDGYLPEDSYFHLVPGREARIRFRPAPGRSASFTGYVLALNLETPVKFSYKGEAASA